MAGSRVAFISYASPAANEANDYSCGASELVLTKPLRLSGSANIALAG
jgi:hypothetical protein